MTAAWSPRLKGYQVSTTVEEAAVRTRPRTGRFNIRQLRDFSLIPVILLLLLVVMVTNRRSKEEEEKAKAAGGAGGTPDAPGAPPSSAGASGAALVAPTSGYAAAVWPGLVKTVDPASIDSIAAGLREAWQGGAALGSDTAVETARVCSPAAGLRVVMTAYAAASQATPAGPRV